jgi:hypothetical protein
VTQRTPAHHCITTYTPLEEGLVVLQVVGGVGKKIKKGWCTFQVLVAGTSHGSVDGCQGGVACGIGPCVMNPADRFVL